MLNINLTGKTAIVTGAAGQLGRVMAKTLARCGADVILHCNKSTEKAREIASEIEAETGVKTFVVSADVSSLDSVTAMRDSIKTGFKLPDIVVTAAVAQYKWTTVLEQPIEDYISQFNTCVLHNVNMAKAFVPHMIENHYGKIIGINTECALRCFEGESAYDAGKRGMDGVMRILAKEVGRYNITVNQVAPGWTISERDRANHTEKDAEYDEKCPMKRRGTDQEIANAVAFLSSDLSSYITGVYLPVCGGNVMPAI